jgi:IS5 family transposase
MKPKPTEINPQRDAFLPELADIINARHELVQLAETIDWEQCESELSVLYASKGRPGASIRLMVGLTLLKHTYALSDEVVVQRWVENPYYQVFCGEKYFQHTCPIDPTTLLRFRKRLGSKGMKKLLALTIDAGLKTGTITKDSFKVVSSDTTVMNKAVAHPSDIQLLQKCQQKLVQQAKQHGIKLRQTYGKELKTLALKAGRYAHARQFKRMKKAIATMRTRVGRLVRDILRKLDVQCLSKTLLDLLKQAAIVIKQSGNRAMKGKDKIYSLHAPEVECIGKGKARTPWEFGCKVSVLVTAKEQFVLACDAHHGNPYDGHILQSTVISAYATTGEVLPATLVDRGYKGAEKTSFTEVHITGRKKGKGKAHEHQSRRNAIEAVIGHMKTDGLLSRNRLLGREGDRINAILCGAGQNLRLILKKLRLLYWLKKWTALYAKLVSWLERQVEKVTDGRTPGGAAA